MDDLTQRAFYRYILELSDRLVTNEVLRHSYDHFYQQNPYLPIGKPQLFLEYKVHRHTLRLALNLEV